MFAMLRKWGRDYFSEPEAAILLIFILGGIVVIMFFGNILAPLLAGLVVAYLLESIIAPLQRAIHMPRWLALSLVYTIFISAFILMLVWLLPLLSRQLGQMMDELPNMLQSFHQYLQTLPVNYPEYIPKQSVDNLIESTTIAPDKLINWFKSIFSASLVSLPAIVTWFVYVLLVPLLAFFFLKDKDQLLASCERFSPKDRGLLISVWREMRSQLGNYIKGKAVEVLLIGLFTYIFFWFFGLNYSVLLSVLVGLSVLVPYLGMIAVTIPVVLVSVLQFGFSSTCGWVVLAYLVIQFIDGNILVPILFSEVVNINPVVIIAAVLFFGGIWGFWGLVFAIPLATLVRALINAWGGHAVEDGQQ